VSFQSTLEKNNLKIGRTPLEILQINMGKLCNQACLHCHVEAGPDRTENMEGKTVDRLLTLLDQSPTIHTIDLTGGAPELNPHFRRLVTVAREKGLTVIDRCNLSVFFEPGQEDSPIFLKEHQVKVVASLPCYTKENVDQQRGKGIFDKSIEALKILNQLGYGQAGSDLTLDLVYNPLGPFLPPAQKKLEVDYKRELQELFGITFNHLYTITNMPIKRFHHDLARSGQLEAYQTLLVNNFNVQAAEGVMCRNLVSVSWDGSLYDCDFNQMLEMPMSGMIKTLWDIDSLGDLITGDIVFDDHCYGCTAGAGSSCGGALT
jgi:radical SAM/Cys-rich protein